MEFIGSFVRRATRELVDIIHTAGKKAYVFYDDSWVGMEPYSGKFHEMAFDGIIKCVFSGYEVRLCADVPAPVHEIRFHPYLFPVGLGGAPTFSPGGQPGRDAMGYWVNTRRALLRKKIERCGLGGYLSLTEGYPDFIKAMDQILMEFDKISTLHETGTPAVLKPKIGILHAWGKLRSWTLSGHFHETDNFVLIHVLEALSGLPYDVEFFSFDDEIPEGLDVIINAGEAGTAWSGGACWEDESIVETLTQWVYDGGMFIGIKEPSAIPGYATYLRMAHVLGVDIDNGEKACHGRWKFESENSVSSMYKTRKDVILTDGKARVLSADGDIPTVVVNDFGKGRGIYLADFKYSPAATRDLMNLINFITLAEGVSDNPNVECTVFPGKIIMINNIDAPQAASCRWNEQEYSAQLKPYEMREIEI